MFGIRHAIGCMFDVETYLLYTLCDIMETVNIRDNLYIYMYSVHHSRRLYGIRDFTYIHKKQFLSFVFKPYYTFDDMLDQYKSADIIIANHIQEFAINPICD